MALYFSLSIPKYSSEPTVLVSGLDSQNLFGTEYIINDLTYDIYEIKYEYTSGPFKEAIFIGNLLAIGHHEYFYLFDTIGKNLVLKLKLDFYFSQIRIDNNRIYVADACGIYCLDSNGDISWHQKDLGIDGVIINQFTDSLIIGEGEYDPPGGWIPFKIDIKSGSKINL